MVDRCQLLRRVGSLLVAAVLSPPAFVQATDGQSLVVEGEKLIGSFAAR
jgi:hypothetical protein